jgi:nitrate reductase (cytochrome), electron transfer subunit
MKRTAHLLGVAALALAALAGCATVAIPDAEFGLRKAGVFEVLTPAPFAFEEEVKTRPAAPTPGSGMPPMITHAVDEHLPITASTNGCLDCHDKPRNIGKPVAAGKARPASAGHYVTQGGAMALSGKHYTCMACHAPQAEVAPLVANRTP